MLRLVLKRFVLVLMMLCVCPLVDMPLNSAPVQLTQAQKAQQKREKAKQKRKKEQEKKREKQQKAKARKVAQKQKETERKKEQAARKEDRNANASYREEVERIKKYNSRANAYNRRDIHHSLGVWGYAGYSSLFQNIKNDELYGKSVGGFGGGVGLGYQMQYKHLLLNTGIEYEHYNSLTKLISVSGNPFVRSFSMLPYPSMEYFYYFSDIRDNSSAGFLQVPVLLGGEWGRWYFLAGPKFGFGLYGKSSSQSYVTTNIVDRELIVPLESMMNHALVENTFYEGSPTRMKYGFDLSLSAEFGIYLDEWIHSKQMLGKKKEKKSFWDNFRYRIGVFADYGLLSVQNSNNMVSGRDLPVVYNNPTQPLDLSMAPVFTMDYDNGKAMKVNPFLVGVKLAIFYELPRKQKKILPLPPEPLPRLAARVENAETGAGVSGAMLSMRHVERDRVQSKTTGRGGYVVGKQRRGAYELWAQRSGFLPSDTIRYNHEIDLKDTVVVRLVPVPRPIEPTLAGYVRDAEKNTAVEASIVIYSMDGTELYSGQTADDGLFVTDIKKGQYLARMNAVGYMPKDDTISYVKDTLYLTMQHIVEGKKVIMRNMFFATNKTKILPQSEPELESLARFLNENPTVSIRIIGHTDAVGSDAANQILSEGRANAVRDDLVIRGIDGARIEAEGRGESEPIDTNDTEEGRQNNRRVEFEITDTGGKDIQQVRE